MKLTRLALIGLVVALAIRGIGGLINSHDTAVFTEKSGISQISPNITPSNNKTAKPNSLVEPATSYISKADYLNALRQRQARFKDQLTNKDLVEQIALRREIALVQLRIDDLDSSYQRYIQLVADINGQLKQYRNYLDAISRQRISAGFVHGNTKPAYDVLTNLSAEAINENLKLSLSDLAKLKFLLGRISEEDNLEERAYLFYKQAVSLDPYSVRFLLSAGSSANRIALYNNAIQFLESGREIQQKNNRQSELFADILANLASAYEGKNQNRKANDYRRQALHLYTKVLGRQHAKTVLLEQLMKSKK